MNLIVYVTFAVASAISFADARNPPAVHIVPKPRSYSQHIREFHECVACNDNDMARKDFIRCLSILSTKTRKIAKSCCRNSYSNDICEKAEHMKLDFNMVCRNPKKSLEVERCMWKKVNVDSKEVSDFRACKHNIVQNYCKS